MSSQILYMMNGRGADPAIVKGFHDAGCDVRDTHSIGETLNHLRLQASGSQHRNTLLVAEVQAGAIPLLTLLRESGIQPPPTMLFDQDANSIESAIKALQLGVQDYVLASEPAQQRELRARVMAERTLNAANPDVYDNPALLADIAPDKPQPAAEPGADNFQWDPDAHILYVEDKYVRLSPVEGRVFDLLFSRRNHMVSMNELIRHGLQRDYANLEDGIKLLRPHMMRLRNKLERYPALARRIVNVRAGGYMFI